jgi:hypothetical protein
MMDGYLELEPTQIPMRATIDVTKVVEVRMEPQMKEVPVFNQPAGRGPGGGKAKRKQTGIRMEQTGLTNVQITTDVQGYSLSFNNPKHAAVMYEEIRLALGAGGGVCQDLTPEDIKQSELHRHAAEVAVKQHEHAKQVAAAQANPDAIEEAEKAAIAEVEPPEVVGISDAAAAAVEADGYEADPEMHNNQYICSSCECEYEFECADPDFAIQCPDCETSNTPTADALLD